MTDINVTQVQSTNDASTVSKCSAVNKNYFKDNFIQEFVKKEKTRAPLIHLGYYSRAVIINKLIIKFIEFVTDKKFLKFQIISCGSGFDTTYWRLSETNLLAKSVFVEIDFTDVIQKKISLINQSQTLRSYTCQTSNAQELKGINKMNYNYYLLEADLNNLTLIENFLDLIHIDYNIPTLFLSECVITYMKESDSQKLINWMARKFPNGGFINYEQIHPDDGFGQVMLKHFNKIQSSLFSVSEYPDCKSHFLRYKNLGFKNSLCLSEWNALVLLIEEAERLRVFSLEVFDEFEEFFLKCVHYVVALAGNGVLNDWINFLPQLKNSINVRKNHVEASRMHCDLQLFRHSSFNMNGNIYLLGGCNQQTRSSKIYKITCKDCINVDEIKISGNSDIQTNMVYGAAAYFELNQMPFVCLYGGRTSPHKVWNNGSPAVFELVKNEFLMRLIIDEGNPVSRYRTPMASLKQNESEVYCWFFGGRTADLNQSLSDFWRLAIKCDREKNLTYSWKEYKKNGIWPCGRFSHSFTPCSKRFELFIVGGLTMNSVSVLNDIWKWSCRSESWEKLQLVGTLLPRFGHSAHLKDDLLFLVGGVNTLPGLQPCLARIDLKSLTVTEFEVSLPCSEPLLLFNHSSELIDCDDDFRISLFGGGGNCFSFGTYLNRSALHIKLNFVNSFKNANCAETERGADTKRK